MHPPVDSRLSVKTKQTLTVRLRCQMELVDVRNQIMQLVQPIHIVFLVIVILLAILKPVQISVLLYPRDEDVLLRTHVNVLQILAVRYAPPRWLVPLGRQVHVFA